jgi:hypothetical protein
MSDLDNFTQPEQEEISIKEQLVEVESDIERVNKALTAYESLKKLQDNDEYKLIFDEMYFKEEVERVSNALTEPTYLKRDQLQNLSDVLDNIRGLKMFMKNIQINGDFAKGNLEELENLKIELKRAEHE